MLLYTSVYSRVRKYTPFAIGLLAAMRVYDLQIDEWNESEAAQHGVSEAEIRQVLDGEPVFLPNKKGHQAPVVMIGPTHGGRLLTVPLGHTGIDHVWRPASAWDSSRGEAARYHAAFTRRPTR